MSDKNAKFDENLEYVPVGILELHEDRHTEEKADIRKHFRKIIVALCVSFLTIIMALMGFLFYLFYSYDFMSYSQDVTTGNANYNYIGNDGDIANGTAENTDN